MKRFSKAIKQGTRVYINGSWRVVSSVHPTRNWVQVDGLMGSFQRGHVEKYSNAKAA